MKKNDIIGAILVLSLIILVGCTEPPEIEQGTYTPTEVFDPDKEINAKTFSSIAEFNDFVKRTSAAVDYDVSLGIKSKGFIYLKEQARARNS